MSSIRCAFVYKSRCKVDRHVPLRVQKSYLASINHKLRKTMVQVSVNNSKIELGRKYHHEFLSSHRLSVNK